MNNSLTQNILKSALILALASSPLCLTSCETGTASDNRAAATRQQEMLRQMRSDKRRMSQEIQDTKQIEWSAPMLGE